MNLARTWINFMKARVSSVYIKDWKSNVWNERGNIYICIVFWYLGVPLTTKSPRTICAALSSDGKYYRGKICKDYFDGRILVQFIDNGRIEVINATKLKQLDGAHGTYSAFALQAYLAIRRVKPTEIVAREISNMTSGECILYTNIIQLTSATWIIDVLIDSEKKSQYSLCAHLLQHKFASDISLDILESYIETDTFKD